MAESAQAEIAPGVFAIGWSSGSSVGAFCYFNSIQAGA